MTNNTDPNGDPMLVPGAGPVISERPPPFEDTLPAEQLLQDERTELPVVAVRVIGPVQVRELPSKYGAPITINVDTSGARVLAPSPGRKRCTIFAFDQEILVGESQAAARARWPKLTPLYFDTRDELWIKSATSTTDVTILVEALSG